MMKQLCENSTVCSLSAYQVIVWHYKFRPCHQPQSLPLSAKLKVACSSSGSERNTFAHTCALFIFNRCRVAGPVQNGSHLSSINNSVTQAQTHRKGKHTLTHAGLYDVPLTWGWILAQPASITFRQLLLFMSLRCMAGIVVSSCRGVARIPLTKWSHEHHTWIQNQALSQSMVRVVVNRWLSWCA